MTTLATDVQATGSIAGHEAQFTPLHRQGNDTPVALYATVTVPLSYEDVVAALWHAVSGGITLPELDNPATVHWIVLDTITNAMPEVEQACLTIADMTAGGEQWETLTRLRMLVLTTYATDAGVGSRPVLAGVA